MRSSAQVLVGKVFTLFGIFVAGVLVARAEGPQSYGLYSAAFAMSSLTVGGATAGLPILMLRRASEGDIDRKTLRLAFGFELAFLGPAILVAAGLGGIILGGLRGAGAGFTAGLFFAANNVATMGQHVQCGRRRYRRAAMADIVAGLLFPILTFVALTLHMGIDGAFSAIALASTISCFLAWTGLPDFESDRKPSRLRALDGWSFTAFGLVNAGYGRVDTITLAMVAGKVSVGYYAAAYRLLGPFDLIGAAFATVYFNRLSEYNGDRERWMRVRRQGAVLLATMSLVGMTVLFVAAPFVIQVFYGPAYRSSLGPARILLLSIVPWSLYWLKSADLASVRLEKRATIALGCGLVLDLLLVAAVGNRFGATGAAWAWVVSESAMFLGLSVLSRKISRHVSFGIPSAPPPQIPRDYS